jgi:hypothetical protein
MSVEYYAFLGNNLENIESRFIQEFKKSGFEIELHPDSQLLLTNSTGVSWIKILSIPPGLERASDSPYLAGFEYQISPRDLDEPRDPEWPPKKVKDWTYYVYTRTAAGRSESAAYMQAFTTAILAKITGGVVFDYSTDKVRSGRTLASSLNKGIVEIQTKKAERMARIEAMIKQRKPHNSYLIKRLLSRELEFDVDGYPFVSWPPITRDTVFHLGDPIASKIPPRILPKPRKKSPVFFTLIALAIFIGFMYLLGAIARYVG